ncbi:MAG: hypothetical protein QM831_00780 [Kofleriaceae bacterium]
MSRYLSLALLFVAACTGAEAAPSTTSTPAAQKAQASQQSDHEMCVAVMQHARTCTDQYIPALVDARASVDQPPGIKDAVAQDRAGVIAKANAEWATDQKDENISAACDHMPAMPDDLKAEAASCQAKTDCGQFVSCVIPLQTKVMSQAR